MSCMSSFISHSSNCRLSPPSIGASRKTCRLSPISGPAMNCYSGPCNSAGEKGLSQSTPCVSGSNPCFCISLNSSSACCHGLHGGEAMKVKAFNPVLDVTMSGASSADCLIPCKTVLHAVLHGHIPPLQHCTNCANNASLMKPSDVTTDMKVKIHPIHVI